MRHSSPDPQPDAQPDEQPDEQQHRRETSSPVSPPEEIGAGLWSIPVPIPGNPLGYTLVYLLETDRGPVLVDAGWDDPAAWEVLSRGIRDAGSDVRHVYGVVCTHFHHDHTGLAGRVREASGAWVAMHPDDAAVVRAFHRAHASGDDSGAREWEIDVLRRAGAGEDEIRAARAAPRWRIDPPATPDRELIDGGYADVPGRRLRVMHTPGHTPGHVCLHLEDPDAGDRLFSGDHVLPRITPHIALYPYDGPDSDPLGDFLASLERVATAPVRHILPAHKHRFSGLAERTSAIADHHRARLSELETALGPGPRTLWQVTQAIGWHRPWEEMSPFLRRMALSEAAAHLRRLERIGRVAGTRDEFPVRFVATRQ